MTPKSILILEPDATLLRAIAEQILQPRGYLIFTAQNQVDGLKKVLAVAPDLLVLHLRPDAATIFLKQVADTKFSVPVILVVEHSTAQIGVELLRLGVRDYVIWPVVPEALLQAVDRVLGQTTNNRYNVNSSTLNFEFADMASHLLRNPLHIIQTSIRCLQTLDLSPQEQQDLLNKMWNQSQRLTDFTNELLKTLRLEVEDNLCVATTPVALPPLVERILDLVKNEKPGLKFSLSTSLEVPVVAADPTKVEMVFTNLLISAIRRCQVGNNIAVSLTADTAEVQVAIRDDGKPIPVQSLNYVFQSYYPVGFSQMNIPSSYQLGLYATRRLVELQKGRVWAQHCNGQGSEFGFSLPTWEKSDDQNFTN